EFNEQESTDLRSGSGYDRSDGACQLRGVGQPQAVAGACARRSFPAGFHRSAHIKYKPADVHWLAIEKSGRLDQSVAKPVRPKESELSSFSDFGRVHRPVWSDQT